MTVRIVSGANVGDWPIAGKTIGEIRKKLKDFLNLNPSLTAWVNGEICGDSVILRDGDVLEFMRLHGRKGGVPDFLSEREVRQIYGDDGFELLKNAGLKPSKQTVFSGLDVIGYGCSLSNTATPPKPLPISVDVESESLTYERRTFHCDRTVALVLKCLIEAHGEIRSTSEIKRAFPDEPWEGRLDLTINRKLRRHESGVGEFVESVSKRGFRFCVEAFE